MNLGQIDLYFIFIQLIGLVAWFMLVISYYREDTNKILVFQTIGTALYCVHYLLLDATSGLFICTFEVVRDFLYYKTDWDDNIYHVSIPIYIIFGIITYTGIVELLPIASSLLDGYSLTKKKNIVVIGAVISYTLWVIYDLCVLSYSGALTDGLVALSNLFILIGETKIGKEFLKKLPQIRKI